MAAPVLPEGFDINDPDRSLMGLPVEEYRELRRTAPVWWQSQPRGRDAFDDDGHWVVTKHAEVKEVSRRADVYSSWENTAIVRFNHQTDRDQIDMQRIILLNMDGEQHTRMRAIVSRGFTPRAVNSLKQSLSDRAEKIVRDAITSGAGNFVDDIASELPLQAIADLLGVPQEDRRKLFEWTNVMVSFEEDDDQEASQGVLAEMVGYFMEMAEDRKANPQRDIVTTLVTADIDGDELTSDEFAFFTLVLSVAGNETTRNATTHGIMAFLENPQMWERYKAERPETAADEIVRWASPVIVFQRTATADVELGGQQIKAGDRVGMYYASANFDEDVFDDPYTFDPFRDPNPHLGFGGTGPHYCLGANLARMEINLIFNAIADHLPDITMLGEPERLRSAWLHAIKSLPVDYKCPVAH